MDTVEGKNGNSTKETSWKVNGMTGNPTGLVITFRGDDLAVLGNIPANLFKLEHKKLQDFTRFLPCDYFTIISMLDNLKIDYKTDITSEFNLVNSLSPEFVLRDYQDKALNEWMINKKGTLILPTGSGKTIVALASISKLRVKTLIIVPTLDLVNQWVNNFTWFKEFSNGTEKPLLDIGRYGGGEKDIQAITVSTYESARLYSKKFRDQFGFLIFDEVHHLSGESWREIAKSYIAPYRLGLTATLESNDMGYEAIIKYVGPIVFQLSPEELRKIGAIANYKVKQVLVKLSTEIQSLYDKEIKIFRNYVSKKRLFGRKGFQQLIFRYKDPEARKALEAHRKCRKIAFNASGKIDAIKGILEIHQEEKIILFCESIPFVESVSETFLIPVISSNTPLKERNAVISEFKDGNIRVIAAGRVLDEGVDVTQAAVGIIISGSAQKRQFVQRLGRVLRPHPGKSIATLYEIITQDTAEMSTADRRKI